jgi:SRSO17 transposase
LSAFAGDLNAKQFRTVSWRDGSKGRLGGRFYAARIYSAERHTKKTRPTLKPIWLIVEDTGEEKRPFKFYFSNLPESTSLRQLVTLIKLRWRVERDYQELKSEIGLDHFEGRTWRGFHHHATLCAVAHGFLALRRAIFPPEKGPVDAGRSTSPSTASTTAADRMVPALRETRPRSLTSPRTFEALTSGAP